MHTHTWVQTSSHIHKEEKKREKKRKISVTAVGLRPGSQETEGGDGGKLELSVRSCVSIHTDMAQPGHCQEGHNAPLVPQHP